MRNEMRGIAVDNGGSEVRTLGYTNRGFEDIMKLNNDFAAIQENSFRIKDVAEPARLCHIIEAPKEAFKGIMAQGITGHAYDNQAISISSQESKTASINYYRQFIFAVAQDALKAWIDLGGYSRYSQSVGSAYEYEAENVFDYAIVACIPIKEFNGVKDCAETLKNTLDGHYVVKFPLLTGSPVIEFNIKRDLIGVVPEGGVAIMGLGRELSEDDISLVVDLGCVTTDIALFQGTALLGKVVSSQFAGSTLLANVRVALADEGYILSESQVQQVLATKMVKVGKSKVDVSDIVNTQARNFVYNYLQKEIMQVLNMNAVNAKQIQNVIPIGALMNHPQDNKIISEIIDGCDLANAEVRILSKDLRYVNIQQAGKFIKRLLRKAGA